MGSTQKITFFGSGINAGSMMPQKLNRFDNSRFRYTPQGATWPFAKLSINNDTVTFSIAILSIYKTAHPSNVKVALGKLGYIYFHFKDQDKDFGFWTFKKGALIRELRNRGYHIDD